MMDYEGSHRKASYPSVRIYYANNTEEADIILKNSIGDGYTYISDNSLATCREFDKVVMTMDRTFYYDGEGFLRSSEAGLNVRRLFHGLNRAKSALCIIVIDNPSIFDALLSIAQGRN